MTHRINIPKTLSIAFFLISIISCVEDDDFKIPKLVFEEPVINGNIILPDAVLGMLAQEINKIGANAKVTFEASNNYLVGYVISDDKAGNHFKEMVVQDAAANPKAGIRVLIDVNPLFTTYQFGQKVFVKLDGLSVGIENGVPSLGVLAGDAIDNIPSFSQNDVIIKSPEVAVIAPLEITIPDFSDLLLNLYVKIDNLQFQEDQVLRDRPFTFAAEPTDEFDGERILESCATNSSTILSTSTFSDFSGLQLPVNQGSATGILTKNFLGDTFNMVLNDPTGLVFDSEKRCELEIVDCDGEINATNVLFEEDFTNKTISKLINEGWIHKNITSELLYTIGDFNTNQYAEISAFNADENNFKIWLITPEINLSQASKKALSFSIQASYDDGTILTPFITNNYTGDMETTIWTQVNTVIPKGKTDGFGNFEPSGNINISCFEGIIRIGFRYSNAEVNATTRYHIDNILVVGE